MVLPRRPTLSALLRALLLVLAVATPVATVHPVVPAALPVTTDGAGRDGSVATGHLAPLAGALLVLTPFRPPAERYGRGHRGVDLAASPGSTVRASGAGIVVHAGPLAGRGVVSIEHPSGLRTTYEPVDASVSAGSVVTAGEPIGTLAAGHPTCAPVSCLHWGARRGPQDYLDPMLLIGRVRIRLEPWS